VFDSVSENRVISFEQQAIYNYLLSKLQTVVCTLCTHVPKHLQFAQLNKKFQSDVKKKRIVQRSELNVLGNKKKNIWELSQSNWEKL